MTSSLVFVSLFFIPLIVCADHARGHLAKREVASGTDWTYEASYDWGSLRPEYAECQTGTQQSPITLSLAGGLSQYHHPTFQNYDRNVTGNWTNWGYGPDFNLAHPPNDYTDLPSAHWDSETAYLVNWHIHAPAEHSVDGSRSRAEMHLVHVNSAGQEIAVFGIRLDPGSFGSPFIAQLPEMVPFDTGPAASPDEEFPSFEPVSDGTDPPVVQSVQMNLGFALDAVDRFDGFWTYRGSLTSPPCTEGIRWFMTSTVMSMSVDQMRVILGASRYSARPEQQVWLHDVNGA